MDIHVQSYISSISFKEEYWDQYPNHYYSITEADELHAFVDWEDPFFRGVIEITCNGVVILDSFHEDRLFDCWSKILWLINEVLEAGGGTFTAPDQGFKLGMKVHSGKMIELINYGGIDRDGKTPIPPTRVFVPASELLPALLEGARKCLRIGEKHLPDYFAQGLRWIDELERMVNAWLKTSD